MASLSLVPTPSVPETSTGSLKPPALRSNRPPKPPMPPSTSARGLGRERLDALDQRVAGVDVDAGIAIGQSRFVLGGGGHRTTRGGRSGDLGITIVPSAARQGAKGRGSATFGGFTQRRGFGTLVERTIRGNLAMALFRLKRWSRIAGVALPLLAMPALAAGAQAADSLYEVAKISVDVTAKDAVAARDEGMAEAQMRAVKIVLQRLLPLSAQPDPRIQPRRTSRDWSTACRSAPSRIRRRATSPRSMSVSASRASRSCCKTRPSRIASRARPRSRSCRW